MTLVHFLAADGGVVAETAKTFGLNWWLFISQCISFIIIAFLLQKFAYQPILAVLEVRRAKIAEGLADAAKIKEQLADAQKTSAEILAKANAEAQKMIDEARNAAKVFADKQTQQAIAEAEQIVAKARHATVLERDKVMQDLRVEVSRLVVDTTAKVVGKVLTAEDHRRLSEEATRELAA